MTATAPDPSTDTATARPVARVVAAVHTLEGAGFGVFRPLPAPGLDLPDPFLLIDEMEPVDHPPGRAQGAPDHPPPWLRDRHRSPPGRTRAGMARSS